MSQYYQQHDREVVDYQLFQLDPDIIDPYSGQELLVRGPKPASFAKDAYFVCLGAGPTFGRFCPKPYPDLLAEALGLEALNLGHGGVGPAYFRKELPKLLDYINNARFAVIEVMSGRSQENSLFKDFTGSQVIKTSDGSKMDWTAAYRELIATGDESLVRRVIAETRNNWVDSYRTLFHSIHVPKILLWFSVRKPRYKERYDDVDRLFDRFPQLVNDVMIDQLRNEIDAYVECVSSRGFPHKLRSISTGKPVTVKDKWDGRTWRVNDYYPSPEMHQDAADELEKQCRKYGNTEGKSKEKSRRMSRQASVWGRVQPLTRLLLRYAARFHAGRGKMYEKKGWMDKAIAKYRRALEMNPREPQYYESLGAALTHHHRYWDNLSLKQALSTGGQLDEAIACFRRACELGPRNFSTCLALGDALTTRGRFAEAVLPYRTAMQLQLRAVTSKAIAPSPPGAAACGPDFIIIGAAKCGTTSMFEYMSAHPRIVPPIRKEIRFFHHVERGLEWYLAHFPPLPRDNDNGRLLTGEASTSYILDYFAPERLYELFPRTRLIAILRNPADRAVSHYHDDRRNSDETRSLEEAVATEMSFLEGRSNPGYDAEYWQAGQRGYLRMGLYVYFMQRWQTVFPKEQLLILRSEDFYADSAATMQRVFAFLGVPDHPLAKYDVYLKGSYAATDEAVRRRLGEFFRPHNQKLEDYLGRQLHWS